jgi:hypothetical protein
MFYREDYKVSRTEFALRNVIKLSAGDHFRQYVGFVKGDIGGDGSL